MDKSILNNNLNDEVSYQEFFRALGYTDRDLIYFRAFDDKKQNPARGNEKERLDLFNKDNFTYKQLKQWNADNQGIYFVVNGGGQAAEKVQTAKAFFIEMDEGTFEEQLKKLDEFPLEPSIIISTKKSLHTYWIIDGNETRLRLWREIQNRLINYFGSDSAIEDLPRVMRLYGFNHCKAEPVLVKLLKFSPNLKYKADDFLSLNLPELSEAQKAKVEGTPEKYGDAVTLQSQQPIVTDPAALNDIEAVTGDLTYIERDKMAKWFADWTKSHGIKGTTPVISKGNNLVYGVVCPWSDAHTDNTGKKQSAILIKNDGKIGYECFHSHCSDKSWKDFRAFYEKDDDTRINEGYKEHKTTAGLSDAGSETEDIFKPISAYIDDFRRERESAKHAIRSGIKAIDDILQGGFSNTLYILNAPTGAGKTALMSNLAENIASQGVKVFYYSLEMSTGEFLGRGASRHSFEEGKNPIPYSEIENDHWDNSVNEYVRRSFSDYADYVDAYIKNCNDNLYVIDCAGDDEINATKIYNQTEQYIKNHPGERVVVFVDYLQILGKDKDASNETEHMKYASRMLYAVSNLGCTVFTVASMPKPEARNGKPDEYSAKDSVEIAYNAGVILGWTWDKEADKQGDVTLADDSDILKKCNQRGYRTQKFSVLKGRSMAKGEDKTLYYYAAYNYITDKKPALFVDNIAEKEKNKQKQRHSDNVTDEDIKLAAYKAFLKHKYLITVTKGSGKDKIEFEAECVSLQKVYSFVLTECNIPKKESFKTRVKDVLKGENCGTVENSRFIPNDDYIAEQEKIVNPITYNWDDEISDDGNSED